MSKLNLNSTYKMLKNGIPTFVLSRVTTVEDHHDWRIRPNRLHVLLVYVRFIGIWDINFLDSVWKISLNYESKGRFLFSFLFLSLKGFLFAMLLRVFLLKLHNFEFYFFNIECQYSHTHKGMKDVNTKKKRNEGCINWKPNI